MSINFLSRNNKTYESKESIDGHAMDIMDDKSEFYTGPLRDENN